jgi:hypothetical protein
VSAALAGLLSALALGPAAARDPCDPSLLKRANARPTAYAPRGDRCEGLYVQEVAGGGVLTVVSFTAGFDDFDPRGVGALQLAWPGLEAAEISIRAQSRRPKLYYRMDTIRPAAPATYAWRTDVLGELNLKRADIGVIAWASRAIGDRQRDVYVPLRIGVTGPPRVPTAAYTLVLVPGVELDQVFVSVAALDEQGRRVRAEYGPRRLDHGLYPAGRSFTTTIPAPGRRGLYRLELNAVQRNGAASTTDPLFFSPGRT